MENLLLEFGRGVVTTHSYSSMKFPIIRLLAMLKGLIQIIIVTILLFNIITAMTMKEAFCWFVIPEKQECQKILEQITR